MAFEQNCLNFCSVQGEKCSKSYSVARIFNEEQGEKASNFAGMYLGNRPVSKKKELKTESRLLIAEEKK